MVLKQGKSAVFTIVSANYFARAKTLAESLRKNNSALPFYVILADKMDAKLTVPIQNAEVLPFEQIRPALSRDITFKYNILEFNTAIKAESFAYLFEQGYERVMYLDPDIFVYRSLQPVFEILDQKSILITPHYITCEPDCTGFFTEQEILKTGLYNFGFTALKNDATGKKIVAWWRKRLQTACYVDFENGLHVDQQWMNLIPVCYPSQSYVIRQLGLNAAAWNVHERTLIKKDDGWYLRNRITGEGDDPLYFYHFSGFDPHKPTRMHSRGEKGCTTALFPEYAELFRDYAEKLLANGYDELLRIPYGYGCYENGQRIEQYHRRIYRELTARGTVFENPFSTAQGSFYARLDAKHLVTHDKSTKGEAAAAPPAPQDAGGGKKNMLNRLLKTANRIMSSNAYFSLLGYLHTITRTEDQAAMLLGLDEDHNG